MIIYLLMIENCSEIAIYLRLRYLCDEDDTELQIFASINVMVLRNGKIKLIRTAITLCFVYNVVI